MAQVVETGWGNQVGPGNSKFRVTIEIWANSTSDTYYNLSAKYFVEVLSRGTSTATLTSNLRINYNGYEKSGIVLTAVGTYEVYTENIGNVARGQTISRSANAWYSSSSTYRSDASVSYTVPGLSAPAWASIPRTTLNPYLTVSDLTTRGYNCTLYGGSTYDTMRTAAANRVLYARAIRVNKGDPISVTGVYSGAVNGAATTASAVGVQYGAMEFDGSGNCLFDASWVQMDGVWIAGENSGGTVLGNRDNIAYIVFLFRYPSDEDITPSALLSSIGGSMFISKYFTYSIDCNGGKIGSQGTLKYYRWDTRPEMRNTWKHTSYTVQKFVDPVRAGYKFLGWRVAPTHTAEPSQVFSSAELNSLVTGGRYYKYLFDDAIFTAQWEATNVAYIKQNGSYVPCNTYCKKDGQWYPAICYVKDENGNYRQSTL